MLALTRRFLPILIVAAISASERVEAGDRPAPRKMTLTEALAHAHEHQPAIREARSRILASERDADATRARRYPLLTFAAQLTATTTNNTTGSYLAVAGLDNPRISATRADGPSSASLVPAPSSLVGLGLRQEVSTSAGSPRRRRRTSFVWTSLG